MKLQKTLYRANETVNSMDRSLQNIKRTKDDDVDVEKLGSKKRRKKRKEKKFKPYRDGTSSTSGSSSSSSDDDEIGDLNDNDDF